MVLEILNFHQCEQFYKGIIGPFCGQFPIIPFIKVQGKIIGTHNMTVLNLLYNEVCYKGTAL